MIQFPPGIDAAIFLRDYWQQKPLLMRQALPGFCSPISADELAGLALEDDVESRIVLKEGKTGPWELYHGPFSEQTFSGLPASPWTLLVQAVDLWVPDVHGLMAEFPFLPRWRMDDIMVSYANDGGGVGPHFDYYDVFLIQAEGQRRWSIGQLCDETSALRNDTDLKILQQFDTRESWVLEPGDILYLPPCVAHHGVAVGECLTFSLGFRAPTAGEMLDDLATEVLSRGSGHYYRDPALTEEMASDAINPAFIAQVKSLLEETLNDKDMLARWFASYMTSPKYPQLDLDDPDLIRKASIDLSDGSTVELEDGQEIQPDH